ncbi:MAG: hypothetical protein MUD08_04885 [Cytophagales bacterium]|jgi:hypothetical protein|nr:hypothetical protein [Cytophagales bacterium]
MRIEDIKKAKATFDDREFDNIGLVEITPEKQKLFDRLREEVMGEFKKRMQLRESQTPPSADDQAA